MELDKILYNLRHDNQYHSCLDTGCDGWHGGKDIDKEEIAKTKQALTELIDREVAAARVDENQMGLNWHIAVKNGLEQQSENAQLTATWKANEQIILEFKTRIAALKPSKEKAKDE